MLKFDRSFHKQSLCQPYCVSYLDQFTHFRPYPKSIMGLMGHPRVIIVVMNYRGGFVLVRMKVYGTFWFVNVHLLSNSLHSLL